jgi:hypothetical protein
VNAICAKNAEFAFVVSTKIDEASPALSGTGERDLVDGTNPCPILVLKEYQWLAAHGGGQAEIREFHDFAAGWLRGRLSERFRFGIHSTIEAEVMYLLK